MLRFAGLLSGWPAPRSTQAEQRQSHMSRTASWDWADAIRETHLLLVMGQQKEIALISENSDG